MQRHFPHFHLQHLDMALEKKTKRLTFSCFKRPHQLHACGNDDLLARKHLKQCKLFDETHIFIYNSTDIAKNISVLHLRKIKQKKSVAAQQLTR